MLETLLIVTVMLTFVGLALPQPELIKNHN